jgi:hypothetical protein
MAIQQAGFPGVSGPSCDKLERQNEILYRTEGYKPVWCSRKGTMMRYVLFDKSTGALVHSHEFYKLDSPEPEEVPDQDLRSVIARFPDAERLDIALTDQPFVSSLQAEMKVDLRTRDVVVTHLVRDSISERLAELHGESNRQE